MKRGIMTGGNIADGGISNVPYAVRMCSYNTMHMRYPPREN